MAWAPKGNIKGPKGDTGLQGLTGPQGPPGAAGYTIPQAAHGFIVGNVVRYNGTAYVKAQADTPANAEVVGMVATVPDANTFTLQCNGKVTGIVAGMVAGTLYFLSPTTAGALTASEPTAIGTVSKPVLFADSVSSGYFYNFRGKVIPNIITFDQSLVLANASVTLDGDADAVAGQRFYGTDAAGTKGWYKNWVGNVNQTANSGTTRSCSTQAQTMLGLWTALGGGPQLTPTRSNRLFAWFNGTGYCNAAGSLFYIQMRYGLMSGGAPGVGSPLMGTGVGAQPILSVTTWAPWWVGGVITGLTIGETYWFDVAGMTYAAGQQGNVINYSFGGFEVQ